VRDEQVVRLVSRRRELLPGVDRNERRQTRARTRRRARLRASNRKRTGRR
jgi:hypothetical protein